MEEEIFKKSHVNFNKLEPYGFVKNNDYYMYSKEFLDNSFRADILIDGQGNVFGKVYDIDTGDEYLNIRVKSNTSGYVNKVRELYKNILCDIKNNCFTSDLFVSSQANRISTYIIDKYNNKPEFLWDKFPDYAVFRNKDNKKWYALMANIDRSKIDKEGGFVEIINVKLDPLVVTNLIKCNGYYEAYHMNKKSWITIILNDTISDEEIIKYIDCSYSLVS